MSPLVHRWAKHHSYIGFPISCYPTFTSFLFFFCRDHIFLILYGGKERFVFLDGTPPPRTKRKHLLGYDRGAWNFSVAQNKDHAIFMFHLHASASLAVTSYRPLPFSLSLLLPYPRPTFRHHFLLAAHAHSSRQKSWDRIPPIRNFSRW